MTTVYNEVFSCDQLLSTWNQCLTFQTISISMGWCDECCVHTFHIIMADHLWRIHWNFICYQELCLDHGVKKYLVALNCITADKSVMDVFQSIMVLQAAAPLIGGVVSRTLFFTTIHAILLLPKEHFQGNKQ